MKANYTKTRSRLSKIKWSDLPNFRVKTEQEMIATLGEDWRDEVDPGWNSDDEMEYLFGTPLSNYKNVERQNGEDGTPYIYLNNDGDEDDWVLSVDHIVPLKMTLEEKVLFMLSACEINFKFSAEKNLLQDLIKSRKLPTRKEMIWLNKVYKKIMKEIKV